jgi:hypothetical protein
MQSKAQGQAVRYDGPCSVSVPVGEWRGFREHAPAWWPTRFATPSPSLIERVDEGLRQLCTS